MIFESVLQRVRRQVEGASHRPEVCLFSSEQFKRTATLAGWSTAEIRLVFERNRRKRRKLIRYLRRNEVRDE